MFQIQYRKIRAEARQRKKEKMADEDFIAS